MTATAKRAELIAGRENKSCDTFFPSTEPCEIQYLPPTDVRGKRSRDSLRDFASGEKNPEKIHPLLSSFLSCIWQYGRMTQLELEQKMLLLLHAVCNLAKSLFIGGKRKRRRRSLTFSSPLNHTSKTHKRWWNDGKAFGKQRISRCKIANKKSATFPRLNFEQTKPHKESSCGDRWLSPACCSTLNPNEQLILSLMGQRGKQKRRRIEQNRRRGWG